MGAPPCENFSAMFLPNIYTMKVHVAWEHSNFKNVDLVAIQCSDPQAQIFNWPIFGKYNIFLQNLQRAIKIEEKKLKL